MRRVKQSEQKHRGIVSSCAGSVTIALLIGAVGLSTVSCSPAAGTIGAILGQRADGTLTLREIPEDLAASNADLQPGDIVLLIDGHDVRNMSSADLRGALGGDEGSNVKLTLERGNEVIRVTLKRTAAQKHHRQPQRP
ncbi:MAG: PDZ domain-containing protein [Polyangiaceae bacterium]|nr:PDZ domain-containing protein [Polyangiaceae bacterium]